MAPAPYTPEMGHHLNIYRIGQQDYWALNTAVTSLGYRTFQSVDLLQLFTNSPQKTGRRKVLSMKYHARTVSVCTSRNQWEPWEAPKWAQECGEEEEAAIAAHAWTNLHQVDWKAAKTREMEGNYWKRRVLEALHIHQQRHTSNLDYSVAINLVWLLLSDKPACSWHTFSNIFII